MKIVQLVLQMALQILLTQFLLKISNQRTLQSVILKELSLWEEQYYQIFLEYHGKTFNEEALREIITL